MLMLQRYGYRTLAPAVAVVAVLALGGCNEYLERRDSISVTSGDAVRQNVVTHVIDPWPRQSRNRNITLSGERAVENTSVTNEAPEDPKERGAATLGN